MKPGSMSREIADEMLTIAPPPRSRMWGIAIRDSRYACVTLKRNAPSRNLSLVRCQPLGGQPPALFTTTSIRPNSRSVAVTTASSCARAVRSQAIASARRPCFRTAAAVSSICSCVRAAQTTSAPTSAYASAIARPMPRPAPITIATLPVSLNRSRIMVGLLAEHYPVRLARWRRVQSAGRECQARATCVSTIRLKSASCPWRPDCMCRPAGRALQ